MMKVASDRSRSMSSSKKRRRISARAIRRSKALFGPRNTSSSIMVSRLHYVAVPGDRGPPGPCRPARELGDPGRVAHRPVRCQGVVGVALDDLHRPAGFVEHELAGAQEDLIVAVA